MYNEQFKRLFDTFYSQVRNYSYGITKDYCESEDITIECFVKLSQRTYLISEQAKAFLFICAKNASINYIKRRSRNLVQGLEGYVDKADEELRSRMFKESLIHNLSITLMKLPQGCRKVLELTFFNKMKESEIAEFLKIKISTVKSHKQRAMKLLKKNLKYE